MSREHAKPTVPPTPDEGERSGSPAGDKKAQEMGASGRVKFDDRGNAVWEWSIETGAFGANASTDRLQRLDNPSLSIADDAPTPFDGVKANPLGTKKGYNPYDSGKLGKDAAARKKTDLRKLGEWLKLKKQASGNKAEE